MYKVPTTIEVSGLNLEWFKLSLLHRDDLPSDVRNSPKFIELNNSREVMSITAINATAQYISKIWEAFYDDLQKVIPDPYIQITVTVPVVRPSHARQMMHKALHEAGILNKKVELAPKFVAEPEAAALAFFSAAYYLQQPQVRGTFHARGYPFMPNTLPELHP
jgi:molecular chaperone DnaK (HSP70)